MHRGHRLRHAVRSGLQGHRAGGDHRRGAGRAAWRATCRSPSTARKPRITAKAARWSARRSTGRVLIVDDVITAGTAIRESLDTDSRAGRRAGRRTDRARPRGTRSRRAVGDAGARAPSSASRSSQLPGCPISWPMRQARANSPSITSDWPTTANATGRDPRAVARAAVRADVNPCAAAQATAGLYCGPGGIPMRSASFAWLALLLSSSLWAAAPGQQSHNRYKWNDGEGNLHYADALPPEAVKYGYEIVSAQGVVIKHVDRPKTSEERAAAKADLAKAQAAKGEPRSARAKRPADARRVSDRRRSEARAASAVGNDGSEPELGGHQPAKPGKIACRNARPRRGARQQRQASARAVGEENRRMRKQVEEQRAYIARKEKEKDDTVAHFDDELAHYRSLKPGDTADRR